MKAEQVRGKKGIEKCRRNGGLPWGGGERWLLISGSPGLPARGRCASPVPPGCACGGVKAMLQSSVVECAWPCHQVSHVPAVCLSTQGSPEPP